MLIIAFITAFFYGICAQAAQNSDYDVIVIGGGPTGLIAAQTALGYGKRVALVEQDSPFKSRTTLGDIPLKALIKAGQVIHNIQTCQKFELSATIELPAHNVLNYIHAVTHKATLLYHAMIQQLGNIAVIQGHAYFVDPHTIIVADKTYRAHRFIIATGGHPYIPPIKGVNTVPYYTKDTLFTLEKLPASIVIIGQGPLGVELATALHHLGIKVTFLVRHGLILPNYDFELVDQQYKLLKASGIELFCGISVKKLAYNNGVITTTYKNQLNQLHQCQTEAVLFALDLIGNTHRMGLEEIGVDIDHDGIVVDTTMKSSVDSIYACGDVVGRMFTLTRVAYYQAYIAAYNASKPFYSKSMHANYTNVSSFIQAMLPLGAIGLTEQEARKQYGNAITIYRHRYEQSTRALIDNTTDGFVKCICHNDGTLLGAHVSGEGADQIIDNLHIGKNFFEQFNQYPNELKTSPNYLDIVWQAALQSGKDHVQPWFTRLKRYISIKVQELLGFA